MPWSMAPKRYQVLSWGEEFATFDTATEVWNLISSWEVGRERVYGDGRMLTREEIKAAMEKEQEQSE
jgi:hypothetical protein